MQANLTPTTTHTKKLLFGSLLLIFVIIAGGLVAAGLLSMWPSAEKLPNQIGLDISKLMPGQMMTFNETTTGEFIPVAVYRHVDASGNASTYRRELYAKSAFDPELLPPGVSSVWRSANPGYFVFYNIDTRFGCKLQLVAPGSREDYVGWGGFQETCRMDHVYDFIGRSMVKTKVDGAQHWLPSRNLFVPRHSFEGDKLYIYPNRTDIHLN